MVTFYLHNCYPQKTEEQAQYAIAKLLKDLKRLKDDGIQFEVITDKMPSEYPFVARLTLLELIQRIIDKDARRLAVALFNKYPIEEFYDFDEIFKDRELPSFKLFGQEAINLYIASQQNYLALSLPFDELSTGILELVSDEGSAKVNNYFGSNPEALSSYLPVAPEIARSGLQEISDILSGKVVFSQRFQDEFTKACDRIQKALIKLFRVSNEHNLLIPCRASEPYTKKFDLDGGDYVYEMRSYQGEGFRICVDCDDHQLFVALFYTKAQANRKNSQRNFSQTAHAIIQDLKKDKRVRQQ